MRRIISTFLVVFLVVCLGFVIFPTQSVEAWRVGGHTFNISAKGQATYWLPTGVTWEGEVSIVIAGEKSMKYPGYHGIGFTPRAEVGCHISGSFGDHIIKVNLQGNGVYAFSPQLIHFQGLKLNGNCDGKPISTDGCNQVMVYGNEGSRTIEVILSLSCISPHPLYIYIDEATADIFKVNIR